MFQKLKKITAINFPMKLVSVIIAVVLWMIVLGSRNIEVTKELPLQVYTATGVVVSNDIPQKVAFRLSGPKAFLRAILDRRDDPISVNLSGAQPGTVTYRFFSDNIRLPIGVKVMSIHPSTIVVKLEKSIEKEVRVRVETQGALPEGHELISSEVIPDTVLLRGPESKLAKLMQIPTVPVDLSGINENANFEAQFEFNRYGVELAGMSPQVKLYVAAKAANFKIKNINLTILSNYKSKVQTKKVTVFVRASQQVLSELNTSDIIAQLDLRNMKKGKHSKVPINVMLPKSVRLVKVVPDKLDVTLF